MLAPAAEDRLKKYHHPIEARDFERLCEDVFEFVLQSRNIPVLNPGHGRISVYGGNGDSQHGIDIRDPATLAVAQCKKQHVITPKMLEAELEKLKGYQARVSHYFFMISDDVPRRALVDWVEKQNGLNKRLQGDNRQEPCVPSHSIPQLHILGWNEIRGHLAESTYLLWKWGLAIPQGCDYFFSPSELRRVSKVVGELTKKVDPINVFPSKDAVAGMQSLMPPVEAVEISKLGKHEIVDAHVVNSLGDFVSQMEAVFKVGQSFDEVNLLVNTRDLVVAQKGYVMLNELVLNNARLSAYPYLRAMFGDAKRLWLALSEPGSSFPEPEEVVAESGEIVDVDGGSRLRFNFTKKGRYYGVWYTDPSVIIEWAERLAKKMKAIEPYIR